MNTIDQRWEQVIYIAIVLTVALLVARVSRYLMGRFVKASALKMNVDPTRYSFVKNAVDFVVYLTAIILIFRNIPALHALSTTLITGAGVLAAIVGFASQAAFSNIISGIFLVIFRPFSVGDRIKVGQFYTGDVEDITLRHTVMKSFENKRIIIPNSVISNETVINFTSVDERVVMYIEVLVTFETNLDKAMAIIRDEGLKHPLALDNRTPDELALEKHPVDVRVLGFTETGVQLRGDIWAANASDGFELKCAVLKIVKERYTTEGIDFAGIHRLAFPPPLKTS